MRGAEVEDGLGRGEVLDVPVLDVLGLRHAGQARGPIILVLYRVLEAVWPEQTSLSLGLDEAFPGLRSLEGEVLGLEEVLTLVMVMVSLLPGSVGSWTFFISCVSRS